VLHFSTATRCTFQPPFTSQLQPAANNSPDLLQMELAELQVKLLEALESLPDGERAAVTLCHMAGLTQQQASEELGLALNTVKSQVKRGLDRLRKRLGPQSRGLEAYLAALSFPPPSVGWEAAVQRWRDGSVSAPPGVSGLSRTALTGVAAVSVCLVLLLVAWRVQENGAQTVTPQVAEETTRVSSLDGASAPDQITGDPSKPDMGTPSTEPTAPTDSGPVSASASVAPSLTPPAAEEIGRSEVQPPGKNPVGTIQVRTDYYASGPIYTQWTELVTAAGPVLHGSFRKFRLNSALWEASQFVNGLREGSWETYHENGAIACRGEFRAGQPSGLWTWYHDNSTKMAEGRFEHGQKQDIWRAWHANGERQFEENYELGKREGIAVSFDEQGRKVRETTWQEGVKHGPETEFDADGNALPSTIYEHGKRK
jgi:antitoxin component YwqK of YwqJK toxin-antitoxin module